MIFCSRVREREIRRCGESQCERDREMEDDVVVTSVGREKIDEESEHPPLHLRDEWRSAGRQTRRGMSIE